MNIIVKFHFFGSLRFLEVSFFVRFLAASTDKKLFYVISRF